MTRFDIYTKTVEIAGNDYIIKPLPGKFYDKFLRVIKGFNVSTGTDQELLDSLSPESFKEAHELCVETMKLSYPDDPVDKIDLWVTQNFNKIFEAVTEINLPDDKS